jgi:hypothetical protein
VRIQRQQKHAVQPTLAIYRTFKYAMYITYSIATILLYYSSIVRYLMCENQLNHCAAVGHTHTHTCLHSSHNLSSIANVSQIEHSSKAIGTMLFQ